MARKTQKPVKDYLPQFLDWIQIEKGLSPITRKNYAKFLDKFFEFLSLRNKEGLKPRQITPELVWQYRAWLANQGLKKTTQGYYLIALRALLSFFLEREIESLAPDKVKLPKKPEERKIQFLTLEQIERLLEAPDTTTLQGLRDRAILETLFSTGMRVSELIALNRDQIKPPKNEKELELAIKGKGGRVRTVYLSERALFWIREYLKARKDIEKPLFVNLSPKKRYSRLTPRSIERIVKKYALLAGLPLYVTPHTIRHSFATDLLSKGVDVRIVQEFLGHKNISTTQIYTHITSKKLKEIHEKYHGKK